MTTPYYDRQADWLAEALANKPRLYLKKIRPQQLVRIEADAAAFQGWAVKPAGSAESFMQQWQGRSWQTVFDFGDHYVGKLTLSLVASCPVIDCPVRLRLVFAEAPCEIGESFDCYGGMLGKGWLQEHLLFADDLPVTIELPRRYAFRYLAVIAEHNSGSYTIRIDDLFLTAQTSADEAKLVPLPTTVPDELQVIDRISAKTLADCMQDIFEDGPKRDRRLWLGDFRLQALSCYKTFNDAALARRCLLLFAGLARESGEVPTFIYDKGAQSIAGDARIYDYVAIFPNVVHEYLAFSGDRELARALWPVVRRQAEIIIEETSHGRVFGNHGQWWCFIDWHPDLDKSAAEHAVSIYGLKATMALAAELGVDDDLQPFLKATEDLTHTARELLFDPERNVFVSGDNRQVSVASQLWMVLAGVVEGEQAAAVLLAALGNPQAIQPVAPYLHHYLVDALMTCSQQQKAMDHLKQYWGGMVDKGADTFWEVYVEGDDRCSPYDSPLMNSYCHAWSCSPSYFLRQLS